MKKIIAILCAIAALAACKRIDLQEDLTSVEKQDEFKVDLTITRTDAFAEGPETRVTVKDQWNEGDVVYVFFRGVPSPKYLEQKYTKGAWVSTPKNGLTLSELIAARERGESEMTGLFFPYGSDATVIPGEYEGYFDFDHFEYSGIFYFHQWSWFWYDGEIHGTLELKAPELAAPKKLVHFDVTGFTDGHSYTFTQEYVKPIDFISLDNWARPTWSIYYDSPIPGYIDKDRSILSFSGYLDDSAVGQTKDYTFNIVDETTGARFTRTVKGKTISKNMAIGLGSLKDPSVWTAIANPVITLDQNSLEMSGSAQKVPGFLSYTLDYPIAGEQLTVTPSASWIHITETTDSQISFYADGNGSSAIRTGTITLSYKNAESQVFTITQHYWTERYTVIEISEHEKEVSHEGGTFTLDYSITHPITDCTLKLEYNSANIPTHDWVSGTIKNGIITYTVKPNEGSSARECKLLVKYTGTPNRDTLRIRQFKKPAGPPEIYSYDLEIHPGSPETINGAGEDNVSLIAYVINPVGGVKLELKPDVSWITNIRQENDMTYRFTASRNTTGRDRFGNIILTYLDQRVTVPFKQLADEGFIILNPGDMTFDYKKRSVAFDIDLPDGYDYNNLVVEYEQESSFIKDLQRSGNTVTFNMKENNGGFDRTTGVVVRYGDVQSVFHVTQTYDAPVFTVAETEVFLSYARQTQIVDLKITNPRENATLHIIEEGDTPWFWSATNEENIPVFNVAENTSGSSRGTFAVIGYSGMPEKVRLQITQSTSHTDMMVNPEFQYIAAATELTYTVKITDPLQYKEVTATPADPWIKIKSVTKDSDQYFTVVAEFTRNRTREERTSSITFKYDNLTAIARVTQSRNHDIPEGFIDMGLPSGTLWAVANLNATSEYNLGTFYAWGEVAAKRTYTWKNYRFGEDDMTKYNDTDKLTVLQDADDPAHQVDPTWSLPTMEQFDELAWYTTQEWVTLPVPGCWFTSQDRETSIFLPATGFKVYDEWDDDGIGYYWSKSLYTGSDADGFQAWTLHVSPSGSGPATEPRNIGMPVRPVIKK